MNSVHTFKLDLSWDLVQELSRIDRFTGEWGSLERREGVDQLKQLRTIATIESVGASTRIEGSRLDDKAVDALLEELDVTKLEDRDKQEVVGYFEALDTITEAFEGIDIGESEVKHLHKLMLRHSGKDDWHRGGYKQRSNAVEATMPDGSGTVVFSTTPPGVETEDAMRALFTWHGVAEPVHLLVRIALFCYELVTIHPFQDGNGRMSRLVATLLLLKGEYPWVQYVSFEHEIEARKDVYYRVLRTCQAKRPGEDVIPWVRFFLECLARMITKLRAKLHMSGTLAELHDRARIILRFIGENPGTQAGAISKELGLALPTVKKVLDQMTKRQLINRQGAGRGTHYTLFETPALLNRYLLVISPSDEIIRALASLKSTVANAIGPYRYQHSIAHITLFYADLPLEYERDLCEGIERGVVGHDAFDLRYEGITHFENKQTIYIDPVDKQPIDEVRKSVVAHARSYKRLKKLGINSSDHPHLTIAAGLNSAQFGTAWELLAPHMFLRTDRVTGITLLRKDLRANDRYRHVRSFPLG